MVSHQRDHWKPWLRPRRPWFAALLLFIGPGVVTGAPPEITTQPQSRTNMAGTVAVFTATATGTNPLGYRWRREGLGMANTGRISDTASNTLAISNVRPADAGNYTLAVSNTFGSVTSLVATLTVTVPATIVIPDTNLEAAIRSLVNKPSEPLSPPDLAALTSLSVCSQDVRDLTGLEWATNLASLCLSHNSITNLAALEGLNNLVQLSVDDNHISDLLSLAGLSRLTNLNIGDNLITNVAVLSGLTNLSSLWLFGNYPDGLTALTNLSGLSSLILYNSGLADITPLGGLINLNYLELRWNPLTNAGAVLAGLTNLTTLYLGGTAISNVNFLQNLPRLTFLNLDHNGVRDLSTLATLPALRGLDVSHNSLTNVGQLAAFTNLTGLYLSGNSVSNMATLTNLVGLTSLMLQDNHITDPSMLGGLTKLNELGLGRNPIANHAALAVLTNLTSLWLDGNAISNLNFTGALPSLKALGVRHNRLNDLTAVGGLTNIIALFYDHNRLTNVAALQNLPLLLRAKLEGNLLDLSGGSTTVTLIQDLQSHGVNVEYLPQNQSPAISVAPNWPIPTNATSLLGFVVSDDTTPADQLLVTASSSNPGLIPPSGIFLETNGNRILSVTPSPNQTGTATITLTAADETGLITNVTLLVTVIAPQPVVMPDTALQTAIRVALDKPAGNLTSVDLLGLNSLTVNAGNVTSLSGLEWATNLTELHLSSNSISSLAVLPGLTRLSSLHLYVNSANDLSPLAAMTNLTSLALSGNAITNLAFLQNLVRLTDLTVTDTAVTNWSALAGLTNLIVLNLTDNFFGNLTFLQPLNHLVTLILANSRLTDVSALATLTNLNALELQFNRLVNIGALTNLPGLFFVDLTMNLLEASADSDLEYLLNQDVIVLSYPQRQAPVFETPGEWFIAANTTSYLHFIVWDSGPPDEYPTIKFGSTTGGFMPNTNLFVNRLTNGPPQGWLLTVIPPVDFVGSSTVTLIATNVVGLTATTTVTLTMAVAEPLGQQVLEGSNLTWQIGGNALWFSQPYVSHDGVSAAQSGSLQDNEESWLQTTVTGPCVLTFWWKISSEYEYDFLEFYIGGQLQGQRISGEVDWELKMFNIPPGAQTVKWRYYKDDGWAEGLDAAWLDQVIVKTAATVTLNNLNQVYNGSQHNASATTTPSDLPVELTYNGSAAAPIIAKSYEVIGTITDANYVGRTTNTLTIAKAVLTAIADNKTRAYGQTNPPFTVSYSGFLNGDSTNDMGSFPTAASTATIASYAGNYPITLTGGTATNYTLNLIAGALSIIGGPPVILSITVTNQTNVVITWTSVSNLTYRVQSKTNLTTTWSDLPPNIRATNSITSAVYHSGGNQQRFYRLMVVDNPPPPVILSLTGAGTTNAVITWTAITNLTYRVQHRPDFASPWINLPDITATNSTASMKDNSAGNTQRFYRIMLVE